MAVFHCILVIPIVLLLNTVASHINPEEALFSYSRCIEIYGNNLEEPLRSQSIGSWIKWDLNNREGTNVECYSQCVAERLSLYDSETNKINVDLIDEQFNTYGKILSVSQNDVDELKKAFSNIKSLGSCKEFYEQYISIHNDAKHQDIIRKLFHGYNNTALQIYTQEGRNIRTKKQSYFEFCEKKHYGEGMEAELCNVRGYNIDTNNPEKFDTHTKCIFEGLRYLNKDGKYNATEIQRDFELVNEPGYKASIEVCVTKGSVTDVYRCFVQSEVPGLTDAFKKAFDYREIRSRDYAYRIFKPNYNEDEIKQLVGEVDTELKCT